VEARGRGLIRFASHQEEVTHYEQASAVQTPCDSPFAMSSTSVLAQQLARPSWTDEMASIRVAENDKGRGGGRL